MAAKKKKETTVYTNSKHELFAVFADGKECKYYLPHWEDEYGRLVNDREKDHASYLERKHDSKIVACRVKFWTEEITVVKHNDAEEKVVSTAKKLNKCTIDLVNERDVLLSDERIKFMFPDKVGKKTVVTK